MESQKFCQNAFRLVVIDLSLTNNMVIACIMLLKDGLKINFDDNMTKTEKVNVMAVQTIEVTLCKL